MTPSPSLPALPFATLALCAYVATPSLWESWRVDLYARGAPIAFAIWISVVLYQFSRRRTPAAIPWITAALILCVAGSISGLRVAHHLSLACAIISLAGTFATGTIALVSAISWIPAAGWFISSIIHNGLSGWERPAFAVISSIAFLAISRTPVTPSSQP